MNRYRDSTTQTLRRLVSSGGVPRVSGRYSQWWRSGCRSRRRGGRLECAARQRRARHRVAQSRSFCPSRLACASRSTHSQSFAIRRREATVQSVPRQARQQCATNTARSVGILFNMSITNLFPYGVARCRRVFWLPAVVVPEYNSCPTRQERSGTLYHFATHHRYGNLCHVGGQRCPGEHAMDEGVRSMLVKSPSL